jgi:hypothetical protein
MALCVQIKLLRVRKMALKFVKENTVIKKDILALSPGRPHHRLNTDILLFVLLVEQM